MHLLGHFMQTLIFMHCSIPNAAGPEFSRESWLSVKYTLGLEFPNVSTHSLISSPGSRNVAILLFTQVLCSLQTLSINVHSYPI